MKVTFISSTPETQQFARQLYEKYTANSDNLNFQQQPCPSWPDLPVAIHDHWCAVAELAHDHYAPPPSTVDLMQAQARLFRYSMRDLEWNYEHLTPQEKSAITPEQYARLKKWTDATLASETANVLPPGTVVSTFTIPLPVATNMWQDVVDFHAKFGLTYDGLPRFLVELHKTSKGGVNSLAEFRRKFLKEENEEYKTATYRGEYQVGMPPDARTPGYIGAHLADALDSLVDLVYVALGTAYLHGFNFEEAWRRVHTANMLKVRATDAGQSARGGTFDVIKPIGWVPPTHLDLVENHAHLPTTTARELVVDSLEDTIRKTEAHDLAKTWDNSDG